MLKLGKIAVLLCGEFRTCAKASEYIFKYMDQLSEDIDYYFATWDVTQGQPVTVLDITNEFVKYDKNLINYQIVKPIDWQHSTYYYQSYLAKLVSILKRRYELDNNIVYDQVIEIRPDLYITKERDAVRLNDFECLIYVENNGSIEFPGATDLSYQTNSFGNDILSNRFYYQKSKTLNHINNFKHWPLPLHNHQILADYIFARRIKTIGIDRPTVEIVIRPNFPEGDLDKANYDELLTLEKEYKIHNRTAQ